MFELSNEEFEDWRSQFVTSNSDKMGLRYRPMAFTEQGVAMLSGVLKSERAIEVNIAIMRAFVKLRQMLASNAQLACKLEEMEMKYDERFRIVFEAIDQLMTPPEKPRKRIGFEVKEPKGRYDKRTKKKHSWLRKQQSETSLPTIEEIEEELGKTGGDSWNEKMMGKKWN